MKVRISERYKKIAKRFLIFSFILFSIQLIFNFSFEKKIKEDIKFWIDDNINYRVDVAQKALTTHKSDLSRYYNDYNEEFLPETQLNKLRLKLKKLNFIRTSQLRFLEENPYGNDLLSFYIEILDKKNLLIVDSRGKTFLIEDLDEKDSFEEEDVIIINNNLSPERVLDSYIYKNKIFISYETDKDGCKKYNISSAPFNKNKMTFKPFFKDENCKDLINSGRMQSYSLGGKEGLLFSVSAAMYDQPNQEPQDEKSMFGKIIFKEYESGRVIVFSKGHRLILGLLVDQDLILSTENGPWGGDEINKIEYKGNYGWPISSYGQRYDADSEDDVLSYKPSHSSFGFNEPIFSFLPSIGISEIIKIPNNFLSNWVDNFIISSLNKGSLFRVKFDNEYKKILFKEEIFIGKRIRDIKYHNKAKRIFMALEDRAELGILSDY